MLRIGFSGDVSFTGFFASQGTNVEATFAPAVVNFLRDNHFNVFNIEGPLTSAACTKAGGIALTSPPSSMLALTELGCRVFNLANNHITDAGVQGLRETIRLAQSAGIATFGAGEDLQQAAQPLIIEQNGVRVGLIGITHNEGMLASPDSPGVFCDRRWKDVARVIRGAKASCDWVVVNYHGGEEFTAIPMPSRRERLFRYIELGADLVVAHHPHVVQGYERSKNKSIYYSLGNFIFDMAEHTQRQGTTDSTLLRVTFTKEDYKVETVFTRIDRLNKRVSLLPDHPWFKELDMASYHYQWAKDAYRVLFGSRQERIQHRVRRDRWRFPSAQGFVRKLLTIVRALRSDTMRPVLLAALEYRVKQRLRVWR